MRYCLTLLAMLLLPVSAMAEQFDLVCTWSAGTLPPQDLTLHVDTDRNTVNGIAANISETEIRYEVANPRGERALVAVVNRYTGSMNVSWSGPAQLYDTYGRGKCVKPTQRQF